MRFLDLITGFAVPAVCELCHRQLAPGETWLCVHCLADLPLCLANRDDLRLTRLPRTAPIAAVDTLLTYSHDNAAGTLIRAAKYADRPELMARMARLLAESVVARGTLSGVDVLVPVPMHWWKRLRRGYNQAEIIARELSRATGIPVEPLLRATRGHRSQTRRSAHDRLHNVEGTFVAPRPEAIAGRHVAVVDDILTTGATLSEAARALGEGAPRAITVVTLAATVR